MKNIYAFIGRCAHALASPFLRILLSHHSRVRVLVLNERGEVLLVRSWFGHQRWSLPGGGIHSGEPLVVAGVREVLEETGVMIDAAQCRDIGSFKNADSNAPFTVRCLQVAVRWQMPRIATWQRLEILDVAWCPLDNLPAIRSQTVDRAVALQRRFEAK